MTREEMLALLERRVSHWQDRDPEAIAADYAETAVLDSPMTGHSVGREAIRRAYETFLQAFWGTEHRTRERTGGRGGGQITYEQRIFDFTGFLMNLGVIAALL